MDKYIKVRTNKQYAVFTLNKDSIVVDFQNETEIGKICLRLQHQVKQIVIPLRVYDAYDMKEAKAKQEGDKVVISSCQRKKQTKIHPLASETDVDSSDAAVLHETTKVTHYGKISLSKEWCDRDVTVYMGLGKQKRLFIEAGAKRSVPTLTRLKAEYGESLYNYPYDTVAYTTHIPKKAAAITFPSIFLRTWEIENGDQIKYQVLETDGDGPETICVAPMNKTDAFTGKNLDCTKDNVDTVTVCEECHEDPDIKALILLVKDTMELCKEIKLTSKNLAARVEALERG